MPWGPRAQSLPRGGADVGGALLGVSAGRRERLLRNEGQEVLQEGNRFATYSVMQLIKHNMQSSCSWPPAV